jgi:hypothetical protein
LAITLSFIRCNDILISFFGARKIALKTRIAFASRKYFDTKNGPHPSSVGSFLNGFSRLREKFAPTGKVRAYGKSLRLREMFTPTEKNCASARSWRLAVLEKNS